MEKETRVNAQKVMYYLPMVLYGLFILVFLVTRFSVVGWLTGAAQADAPVRSINWVPFKTLFFYTSNNKVQYLDIYANILMFVPMGVYIHSLYREKKLLKSVLTALLAGLLVEGMQFVLATGVLDIDDILMNFLGSVIGIGIYHMLYIRCGRRDEVSRAAIGTVAFMVVPLLFLTVLQYALWLPRLAITAVSLVALAAFYGLVGRLTDLSNKALRVTFIIAAVGLPLVYFGLVLPGVSPAAW